MTRRVYPMRILINGRILEEVIVDPHYERKHSAAVSDEIILALVKLLNGRNFEPEDQKDDGYKYFVNDRMELNGRLYKLIWLLQDEQSFLGIVNAYRRPYEIPE
jgi:hypothetical protein